MKKLLFISLLIGSKAYSQGLPTVKQIDSLVAVINKMPLARKGEVQEIGIMKNSTLFFYDSTKNVLHKVVQNFGSEQGSMEITFYYSNQILQKCVFTTTELKKKPKTGYIYYAGEKVLLTNTEGEIDMKTNRWRGQSFVEEFQNL